MKKEFIKGKKYTYEKEDLVIEVIFDIENGKTITDFWVSKINYGLKQHCFGILGKLEKKEIKKYIITIKYFYAKGIMKKFNDIEEIQNAKILEEYYKKEQL